MTKQPDLKLNYGSRVAVMDGGPAGSFFSPDLPLDQVACWCAPHINVHSLIPLAYFHPAAHGI